MKQIIESLKRINYRMFIALLVFGLIPTIYTTFRIFLIGQLPGEWGFSIAGQLQWVNLLYEILQEALILPLFYFIGAVVANKEQLKNRIKTGLIFTFGVYTTLSLLIIIFAEPLVVLMAQDSSIITETVDYIRLETLAMIFATSVKYLMVVLVTIKKDKNVYFVLVVQLLLTVLLDVFFASTLPVSLSLGVNGIALTNIVVNALLLGFAVYLLHKNELPLIEKQKLDFGWFKELARKGSVSGLESLVRNLFFMFMIVRMINVVGEQGTFWVANNFIWGWLLLPVLQLGELIKADIGEEGDIAIRNKSLGYFAITTIIVVLWGLTIPLWDPFLEHALQLGNHSDVYFIALISLGFYVLFAYNNIIDSTFYGLGKTNYMLFQSLAVNIIFYGVMFVLFQAGVWIPDLTSIALVFAGGTATDAVLTYGMYVWMLKKRKVVIYERI